MRHALCVMAMTAAAMTAAAQKNLDFASKFMQNRNNDTEMTQVTIGPNMLQQLLKSDDAQRSASMTAALQKLKSVQMITAQSKSATRYEEATTLLQSNSKRFAQRGDFDNDSTTGAFYTRKNKKGDVVELVMLNLAKNDSSLVIIDITGDIDEQLIKDISMLSLQ